MVIDIGIGKERETPRVGGKSQFRPFERAVDLTATRRCEMKFCVYERLCFRWGLKKKYINNRIRGCANWYIGS